MTLVSKYPFPVTRVGDGFPSHGKVEVSPLSSSRDTASWHVPEERPVAFITKTSTYAIMLATPEDLVEFAIGFLFTEQVINSVSEILKIDIAFTGVGIDLSLSLAARSLERLDVIGVRMARVGNSSCGICGVKSSTNLNSPLPKVSDQRFKPNTDALLKAMNALEGSQPLNRLTRSVHGAAWVNEQGDIILLKEDVGRHNALDKLIGAMMLAEIDVAEGFVVLSSRCSYELVDKAARFGVRAMMTVSGPTKFAIEKAFEANLALFARSEDGVVEIGLQSVLSVP